MSDIVTLQLIKLIGLRYTLASDAVRREMFRQVEADRIEAALGEGATDSFGIQSWTEAQRVTPQLTVTERETIRLWAKQRWLLHEAVAEVRRLEHEQVRFLDWQRVRHGVQNDPPPPSSIADAPASIPADADVIAALRARSTPIARLQRFIRAEAIDWDDDHLSHAKAYVMACWSELAYLELAEHELAERDRYKIFELSLANSALRREALRINLTAVIPAVAEYRVEVIVVGSYVYLIADLWGAIVVAVRGTRMPSVTDWAINLKSSKRSQIDGFHHRGFDDEAVVAREFLEARIGARSPVYFTGHSMGAAVAAILAKSWRHPGRCRTPYLFACPRFEGGRRVGAFKRYGYVRPYDIVPHVPFRWQGFADAGGPLHALPLGEPQRGFAASVRHWIRHASAAQHAMEQHRRLLGATVGEHHAATAYVDTLFEGLKRRGSEC